MYLLLLLLLLLPPSASSTSFLFNNFSSPPPSSNITFSGIARIVPATGGGSFILLTNTTARLYGRAFYSAPLNLSSPTGAPSSSFSTTFVFSISPLYETLGGHGMAFVMAPSLSPDGVFPSQYLGLLNSTNDGNASNHLFAVEFDTVQDLEFADIDDNHVGINVNSMTSVNSTHAAYWVDDASRNQSTLQSISLKDGSIIQAWVDYDGVSQKLNVSIAPLRQPKPGVPLLSVGLDLSEVLQQETYVGFSGSTGVISGTHRVLAWSFSCGESAAEALDLSLLPSLDAAETPSSADVSKKLSAGLASALVAAAVLLLVLYYYRWRRRRREAVEGWELEYGLHRYRYKELSDATKNFSENEVLGVGGFGKVYRGVMPGYGREVAVKRLSRESGQGEREFIAEMASMGRLRHENLVALLGWSRREGELLLVYEYMVNGSLDKVLFGEEKEAAAGAGGGRAVGAATLRWEQRQKIVKGIAAAMAYLHEGWEQQVVHRDIKASNVLLDAEMNAKLGDFGLSRLYEHGGRPHTTKVVGTLGYLAPEFARTGKATAATDVYSFGIVILELMTGHRPILPLNRHSSDAVAPRPQQRRHLLFPYDEEDGDRLPLADAVWSLLERGHLLDSVDPRLHGLFDPSAMERMLLLGLLCSHPFPTFRPAMSLVVRILDGAAKLPPLPSFEYAHSSIVLDASLPSLFSSSRSNSVDGSNTTCVSAR